MPRHAGGGGSKSARVDAALCVPCSLGTSGHTGRSTETSNAGSVKYLGDASNDFRYTQDAHASAVGGVIGPPSLHIAFTGLRMESRGNRDRVIGAGAIVSRYRDNWLVVSIRFLTISGTYRPSGHGAGFE